ncbi:MAG: hypothetical protein MRQ10_05945, partial [Candidatus Midichloria mitochondrii]|nr:hypothetical protein [Candidatus Midichloria mitochondrii]
YSTYSTMKISYHLVAVYNYQAFAAYAILKLLCEEVVEARLCVVFFGGVFLTAQPWGRAVGPPGQFYPPQAERGALHSSRRYSFFNMKR